MVHLTLTDADGRIRRLPAQPSFERDLVAAILARLPWWARLIASTAIDRAIHAVIKDAHDLVRPRLSDGQ